MGERNRVMSNQISTFNDYVTMLDLDRERERLDMEKLRNEMALSKNLNKKRAMRIEEAMINTDILIGDKHALNNYAGIDTYMISDAPIGNIRGQGRKHNFYGSNVLDWDGYKSSNFTNFRTDDYLEDDSNNLYNNFSMINLHKRP